MRHHPHTRRNGHPVTTYDELTPGALWLLENLSELDIVQMCADNREALAALHQGEEPYEEEGVVPTPGQWIWKWNRATTAQRLDQARRIRDLNDTADRIEALARHWENAQPLLPGQALADLRHTLSGSHEPVMRQTVRVGDRLIEVRGHRVPTPDERRALAALLEANAATLGEEPSGLGEPKLMAWNGSGWFEEWADHISSPFRVLAVDVPPALRGPNAPTPEPDPAPLRKLAEQALGEPEPGTVRRDPRADDPNYDGITGYRTWEELEADPPQFTGFLGSRPPAAGQHVTRRTDTTTEDRQ